MFNIMQSCFEYSNKFKVLYNYYTVYRAVMSSHINKSTGYEREKENNVTSTIPRFCRASGGET